MQERRLTYPSAVIPVGMYDAIPGAALWIVPEGRHIPIFKKHLREFEDVALEFLQTQQPPR
jgi:hypothetical protein